jgi:cold shock CspA family protein
MTFTGVGASLADGQWSTVPPVAFNWVDVVSGRSFEEMDAWRLTQLPDGFANVASDSSLSDGGEVTVFVYIRNVVDRVDELQPGQRVQFEPRIDSRNGKPEARDVRLLDDDRRDTQPWSAENA